MENAMSIEKTVNTLILKARKILEENFDKFPFDENYTADEQVIDMITVMEDAIALHEGTTQELIQELNDIFALFTTPRC
jgi:hypothetical protein